MIIKKKENSYFIYLCEKINDIFDIEEVKKIITKICKKILKSPISGILYTDLYLDQNDNVFIEISQVDTGRENLEIKLIFHLDNDFFWELDDLFLGKQGETFYYYQKNFYQRMDHFLEENEIIQNSEFGSLIYGEKSFDIMNNAIVIKQHIVPY